MYLQLFDNAIVTAMYLLLSLESFSCQVIVSFIVSLGNSNQSSPRPIRLRHSQYVMILCTAIDPPPRFPLWHTGDSN